MLPWMQQVYKNKKRCTEIYMQEACSADTYKQLLEAVNSNWKLNASYKNSNRQHLDGKHNNKWNHWIKEWLWHLIFHIMVFIYFIVVSTLLNNKVILFFIFFCISKLDSSHPNNTSSAWKMCFFDWLSVMFDIYQAVGKFDIYACYVLLSSIWWMIFSFMIVSVVTCISWFILGVQGTLAWRIIKSLQG